MGRAGSCGLTPRTRASGSSRNCSGASEERLRNRTPSNPSPERIGEQLVIKKTVSFKSSAYLDSAFTSSRAQRYSVSPEIELISPSNQYSLLWRLLCDNFARTIGLLSLF